MHAQTNRLNKGDICIFSIGATFSPAPFFLFMSQLAMPRHD